ncbi:MAG: hypothetical protein R2712_13355 [Vicinamibacterales bacterium]
MQLPEGASPVGTMPALDWSDGEGRATLAHLPAFVRVPYADAGTARPWNVGRLMDVVTIVTLLAASAVFAWRTRLAGTT